MVCFVMKYKISVAIFHVVSYYYLLAYLMISMYVTQWNSFKLSPLNFGQVPSNKSFLKSQIKLSILSGNAIQYFRNYSTENVSLIIKFKVKHFHGYMT